MQNPDRPGITIPLNRVRRARDVGAKAAGAGRLLKLGFAVPDGFCISSNAYRAHLWNTGVRSLARYWSDEPDFDTIHRAILGGSIPPEVSAAIESAYTALGTDVVVAVRHSASDEETAGAAYATVLGVRGLPAVIQAVKVVWASIWTEESVELRDLESNRDEPVMAVLVQVMVDSVVSGTASSANPVTGNPNELMIRSTWGIFSEAEAADESTVDLGDLRTATTEIARKEDLTLLGPEGLEIGPAPAELVEAPSLSISEAVELAETVVWVEKSLGTKPVIQWANDGKCFYILGSRPIGQLPDYFPVEPRPGAWRIVSLKPISEIAQSIAGRLACWNGRAYRRLDAEAPSGGMRIYRKFVKHAEKLLKESEKAIINVPERSTSAIASTISLTGKSAALTSDWMETALALSEKHVARLRDFLSTTPAEPALVRRLLLGHDDAARQLDIAFQDLGAYAWQAAHCEDAPGLPDEKIRSIASRYGYSFRNELEAIDPSTWRNWIEAPEQMLRIANALARGPLNDVELTSERSLKSADLARVEATAAVNWSRGFIRRPFARRKLRKLLRQARAWSSAVGRSQQVHAMVLSALRANLMELGSRLSESGVLSYPDDIFHMKLEEVRLLHVKMNSDKIENLRRTIARRKHEMWMESRLSAPDWIADHDMPDEEPMPPSTARILPGTPVSAGEAVGRALVVSSFEEALDLQPGDILIADEIAPAWTPLLSLAGGLVISTDVRFAASSTADLGIPCVIARGASSIAKTGHSVRVDGNAGVVEIVRR